MQKLLVSFKELRDLGVPYSDEHIRRLVKAQQFPAPIKLNGKAGRAGRNAWVLDEVVEWVETRIAERNASEVKRIGQRFMKRYSRTFAALAKS